ncbi:MAG: glycosyltransferase, partial [Methylophilaceae bacterium]
AQQTLPATKNCTIVQHAATEELMQLLASSEYIICRSGYTSLMELMAMRRKMILIPTPGQTEQQYLADYFMQQGWGFASIQDSLDLSATLQAASEYHYRFPTLAYFNTERLQELLSAIVWHRH